MKRLLPIILVCVLSLHFVFAVEQKTSFLIPSKGSAPRQVSKNELKESIGEELKKALYGCNEISAQLGVVQSELASLQKKLLDKVESLVENKHSFKTASRKELSDTFEIVSQVKEQLNLQKQNVKKIVFNMNKSRCLKEEVA